jgi:hypothetical protein
MTAHKTIEAIAGVGLDDDQYATGEDKYSEIPDIREVPLIEVETLLALERGLSVVLRSDDHRRNLTTVDVPLNHLVG